MDSPTAKMLCSHVIWVEIWNFNPGLPATGRFSSHDKLKIGLQCDHGRHRKRLFWIFFFFRFSWLSIVERGHRPNIDRLLLSSTKTNLIRFPNFDLPKIVGRTQFTFANFRQKVICSIRELCGQSHWETILRVSVSERTFFGITKHFIVVSRRRRRKGTFCKWFCSHRCCSQCPICSGTSAGKRIDVKIF